MGVIQRVTGLSLTPVCRVFLEHSCGVSVASGVASCALPRCVAYIKDCVRDEVASHCKSGVVAHLEMVAKSFLSVSATLVDLRGKYDKLVSLSE